MLQEITCLLSNLGFKSRSSASCTQLVSARLVSIRNIGVVRCMPYFPVALPFLCTEAASQHRRGDAQTRSRSLAPDAAT
jgi:hypothetical protein